MEATLLSNWKSLAIKKYDGTIDPDEHLDIYITQVRLYTIGSVVLCWVFPTSLKEEERITSKFHGMFRKYSFGYPKPRPSRFHAPLDNGTYNLYKKSTFHMEELQRRATKYMQWKN
ncbi:hypothetical protein JHK84_055852 [Glycine max]|nr:hypothetical protein JHK84_055852 [Glycine max]